MFNTLLADKDGENLELTRKDIKQVEDDIRANNKIPLNIENDQANNSSNKIVTENSNSNSQEASNNLIVDQFDENIQKINTIYNLLKTILDSDCDTVKENIFNLHLAQNK